VSVALISEAELPNKARKGLLDPCVLSYFKAFKLHINFLQPLKKMRFLLNPKGIKIALNLSEKTAY
jgi:hypothetical protein